MASGGLGCRTRRDGIHQPGATARHRGVGVSVDQRVDDGIMGTRIIVELWSEDRAKAEPEKYSPQILSCCICTVAIVAPINLRVKSIVLKRSKTPKNIIASTIIAS